MTLQQRTVLEERHVTVFLSGEIDHCNAPRLSETLCRCLETGPELVTVDLTQVSFCGCAGVNVLLQARRRAAGEGATLTVSGVRAPRVARLFDVVGVDAILGLPQPT
ncbi:STAS domain-containing protein [Streptomyces sp. NPDC001719]